MRWPRRYFVNLAIIAVLPLAGLTYWLASPVRTSADGSPSPAANAESGSERSIGSTTTAQEQPHPPIESLRNTALTRLHETATARFVSAPFNGVGRIGMTFYPSGITHNNYVTQTGQLSHIGQIGQIGGIGTFAKLGVQRPSFPAIHIDDDSTIPGVSAASPNSSAMWEVRNVDLVGLLKRDRPVVYISEKLITMTDLKHVPTREMDRFEVEGLEQLQDGQDHFARKQDGTIRLLGSVRAQEQCLSCHVVPEGKLLGAFSYSLRSAR